MQIYTIADSCSKKTKYMIKTLYNKVHQKIEQNRVPLKMCVFFIHTVGIFVYSLSRDLLRSSRLK